MREKELQGRPVAVPASEAELVEMRTRVASVEAALIEAQTEKKDLQEKVQAGETEIALLRKRIEDAKEEKPLVRGIGADASIAELQAQLEDTKKQLDAAEREKKLLSDKISSHEPSSEPGAAGKKTAAARGSPGIRGSVLAVNQAYNFVVLSLGGRQGVEPNTEMLVLRGGSFIGKIRVSSVEPATAIGDIVASSLARGVQVQPGDTVVYAGTNF